MGQYRKKPVVVEAFQLGIDYIPDWFMNKARGNIDELYEDCPM